MAVSDILLSLWEALRRARGQEVLEKQCGASCLPTPRALSPRPRASPAQAQPSQLLLDIWPRPRVVGTGAAATTALDVCLTAELQRGYFGTCLSAGGGLSTSPEACGIPGTSQPSASHASGPRMA